MTAYEASLSTSFVRYHDYLGGLAQTNGIYTLDSSGVGGTSVIDALFKFVDTTLVSVILNNFQGSPLYSQPLSANVRDAAADFLQRHQTFTGDSGLEAMRNMLDGVDVTKDTTKTVGNLKLEVKVSSVSTSFSWRYTFNGAVYSGLSVFFRTGGAFWSFGDDRSYYTIGGTDVNVSSEEAISIALERAENYTYSIAGENITLTNANIVKDHIGARLLTRSRYKPLELYPYWMVDLPLDKVYPGFVSFIEVLIWADTGEVFESRVMGGGGGLPPDGSSTAPPTTEPSPTEPSPTDGSTPNEPQTGDNPDSTPDESQTGNGPASLPIIYIIAAVAAIAIPIATAAVILKKKHK
jgi:hypothetical protein